MNKEGSCSVPYDNDVCSSGTVAEEDYQKSDTEGNPVNSKVDNYLCVSSQGQILDVNDSYCRLVGYSREELLRMNLKDLDASECRKNIVDNLFDIIKQSKGRFEVTHRTRDGRLLDMEVTATCIDYPDSRFVFILKDITGLSQTDRFFLEKGDTYVSLFKHNKAVMLLIDPDNFAIMDANITACKYYGWPLEKITRMGIHEINMLSPEDIHKEMQNAVDEKRNYFLFKHRLANGQVRDVEVYSSPVTVNSQNLLFSIIHDITVRKQAEDDLKTREMQLRTAQKVGHIGSWQIDLNSGKVDGSEEARRIYGFGDGQLTLVDIQKTPLPEYRQMLNEALKGLINGKSPYNIQFKIKRQNDGAIRDIHSIAEYYLGRNIVIGTIEDITERKEAEDALLHAKMVAEEANRIKDEFLATMSHELRTPLTSVIGFSDVLLDDSFGSLDDKQLRYVKHISDAGKHLLKLINDVLDLSKVEAGKMELEYETFSVNNAFEEVSTLITPLAMAKHLKLNVAIDDGLNKIHADRTKFKQILYNLVSNAIKFTPEKGSIDLNAQLSENMVIVSVKDTGVGISKEDIDKLFHPFKQLNSYVAKEYAGTGLGLSLVKKYVELHKGGIWVESKIGEGSTFYFSIPL